MRRYRAWHMKNGKGVKKIEFQAKSLRAAKSRATRELAVEHGVWFQGTVFVDGKAISGYIKRQQGIDGATGLNPTIDLIEV